MPTPLMAIDIPPQILTHLHSGRLASGFTQSDLPGHTHVHTLTCRATAISSGAVFCLVSCSWKTWARDRTTNLLVTSQPTLAPETACLQEIKELFFIFLQLNFGKTEMILVCPQCVLIKVNNIYWALFRHDCSRLKVLHIETLSYNIIK